MMKEKILKLPVSIFGIVLGLMSLGIAWRFAAQLLHCWQGISLILLGMGMSCWIAFLLLYLVQWIWCTKAKLEEWKHPIQGAFTSLIPVTGILIGIALVPQSRNIGEFFIIAGSIGQLIFSSYHSAGHWRGKCKYEDITQVEYLPTVAANFASAMGMGLLGYRHWGYLFFGAGIFSWVGLEAAVVQSLWLAGEMKKQSRPVLGIQLAPAFVGAAAYMSVVGGRVDIVVEALTGYGLLNLLYLIRLFKWVYEDGFVLGMWAFSFGLASMANVGVHIYAHYNMACIGVIGLIMLFLGTIFVIGLMVGTLSIIIKWCKRNFNHIYL